LTRVSEWYLERRSNSGERRATVKSTVLAAKYRNFLA
jgi:hypothetical protein